MGNLWWLLVVGAGMWAVMIAAMVFGKKTSNPDACPKCGHEAGLNSTHCADEIPDLGGWRQNEPCACQNDYHWRYESIRI